MKIARYLFVFISVLLLTSCASKENSKIEQTIKDSLQGKNVYFFATDLDLNFMVGGGPGAQYFLLSGMPTGNFTVKIDFKNKEKEDKLIHVAGFVYFDAGINRKVVLREGFGKDLKEGDLVHIICVFRDTLQDDGFGNYKVVDPNRTFIQKDVFDSEMATGTPVPPVPAMIQDYIKNHKKFPSFSVTQY